MAIGRDPDEPAERAVESHQQIRSALVEPHGEHPNHRASSRSDGGVDGNPADTRVGRERRTGIETIPAEPEDERAQGSHDRDPLEGWRE